ncbi:MAG: emp24/gp25L/p24 family protein [Chloroflexota bacterium]|nr:emp24/gp25L/p24 family protein [Chloroflexota bacterium]
MNARGENTRTVLLESGDLLSGTVEADGGFGRIDVLMRIVSPQGAELYAPPKASQLDFTLAAKIRGDYSFVFDNRYSLFTPKSIGFYYCIDRGRRPRRRRACHRTRHRSRD